MNLLNRFGNLFFVFLWFLRTLAFSKSPMEPHEKLRLINQDNKINLEASSETRFEVAQYLLLPFTTCLFINQCFAQTSNQNPREPDARQLAQEHISNFLAKLPVEGRVECYGIYDESESYQGPSRKIGWSSFNIRVDQDASQVFIVSESVSSGTYFGIPCERRNLTTHCFNAKAPWNPLAKTYQYTETRSNEEPLKKSEERHYLGDMVNIRYKEAGESRSVTLPVGKYSLVDEILADLLASLNTKSSLAATRYEEPSDGMQYDHTTMRIAPTYSGWEIVRTIPDGTFSVRVNAGKDGSTLFEEYPFKQFAKREDESTSKAGTYVFTELPERNPLRNNTLFFSRS